MSTLQTIRGGIAATVVAAVLMTGAAPALASANVRDVSDAMRYGVSAPLGSVIADFKDNDDDTETYPAPWPVNFFGTKYEGLCVTTNGGVYPVADGATACSDGYDEGLDQLALDSSAPMIAVLAVDANTEECDDARVAQRDGAGDGFGFPCSIYVDTTATIDGRDAFVVTWYRVSQYTGDNDATLENTYQLALIKLPTVNGDTLGYNFDLEFNYGTITDGEDGYSAEDPTSECESGTDDCRWGIGIASYDSGIEISSAVDDVASDEPVSDEPVSDEPVSDEPVSDEPAADGTEPASPAGDDERPDLAPAADPSAVGYEFFAPTVVEDMMDSGATPLIANSLGTDVLGRYTCGMVNGAAVGCDPVDMQAPQEEPVDMPAPQEELASTGVDDSAVLTGFLALLVAAVLIASGVVLARRSTLGTTSGRV